MPDPFELRLGELPQSLLEPKLLRCLGGGLPLLSVFFIFIGDETVGLVPISSSARLGSSFANRGQEVDTKKPRVIEAKMILGDENFMAESFSKSLKTARKLL